MNDSDPMMTPLEAGVFIGLLVGAVGIMALVDVTVGVVIVGACLLYLFWKAI